MRRFSKLMITTINNKVLMLKDETLWNTLSWLFCTFMGWVKTENVLPHSQIQKLFLLHLLFLRGWKVFILMWGKEHSGQNQLKIVSFSNSSATFLRSLIPTSPKSHHNYINKHNYLKIVPIKRGKNAFFIVLLGHFLS